jgi:hypothetical protein
VLPKVERIVKSSFKHCGFTLELGRYRARLRLTRRAAVTSRCTTSDGLDVAQFRGRDSDGRRVAPPLPWSGVPRSVSIAGASSPRELTSTENVVLKLQAHGPTRKFVEQLWKGRTLEEKAELAVEYVARLDHSKTHGPQKDCVAAALAQPRTKGAAFDNTRVSALLLGAGMRSDLLYQRDSATAVVAPGMRPVVAAQQATAHSQLTSEAQQRPPAPPVNPRWPAPAVSAEEARRPPMYGTKAPCAGMRVEVVRADNEDTANLFHLVGLHEDSAPQFLGHPVKQDGFVGGPYERAWQQGRGNREVQRHTQPKSSVALIPDDDYKDHRMCPDDTHVLDERGCLSWTSAQAIAEELLDEDDPDGCILERICELLGGKLPNPPPAHVLEAPEAANMPEDDGAPAAQPAEKPARKRAAPANVENDFVEGARKLAGGHKRQRTQTQMHNVGHS